MWLPPDVSFLVRLQDGHGTDHYLHIQVNQGDPDGPSGMYGYDSRGSHLVVVPSLKEAVPLTRPWVQIRGLRRGCVVQVSWQHRHRIRHACRCNRPRHPSLRASQRGLPQPRRAARRSYVVVQRKRVGHTHPDRGKTRAVCACVCGCVCLRVRRCDYLRCALLRQQILFALASLAMYQPAQAFEYTLPHARRCAIMHRLLRVLRAKALRQNELRRRVLSLRARTRVHARISDAHRASSSRSTRWKRDGSPKSPPPRARGSNAGVKSVRFRSQPTLVRSEMGDSPGRMGGHKPTPRSSRLSTARRGSMRRRRRHTGQPCDSEDAAQAAAVRGANMKAATPSGPRLPAKAVVLPHNVLGIIAAYAPAHLPVFHVPQFDAFKGGRSIPVVAQQAEAHISALHDVTYVLRCCAHPHLSRCHTPRVSSKHRSAVTTLSHELHVLHVFSGSTPPIRTRFATRGQWTPTSRRPGNPHAFGAMPKPWRASRGSGSGGGTMTTATT